MTIFIWFAAPSKLTRAPPGRRCGALPQISLGALAWSIPSRPRGSQLPQEMDHEKSFSSPLSPAPRPTGCRQFRLPLGTMPGFLPPQLYYTTTATFATERADPLLHRRHRAKACRRWRCAGQAFSGISSSRACPEKTRPWSRTCKPKAPLAAAAAVMTDAPKASPTRPRREAQWRIAASKACAT